MSDVWYCVNDSDTGDWVTSIWEGLGVPAAQIPSTGTSGPAYLFNDIAGQGATATDEFSSVILTVPPVGTFTHDEYSRLTFSDAPDGTYTATYSAKLNGVPYLNPETSGEWVITLTIGGGAAASTVNYDIGEFGFSAAATVTRPPIEALAVYDIGAFGFTVFATQPTGEAPHPGSKITFAEKSRTIKLI